MNKRVLLLLLAALCVLNPVIVLACVIEEYQANQPMKVDFFIAGQANYMEKEYEWTPFVGISTEAYPTEKLNACFSFMWTSQVVEQSETTSQIKSGGEFGVSGLYVLKMNNGFRFGPAFRFLGQFLEDSEDDKRNIFYKPGAGIKVAANDVTGYNGAYFDMLYAWDS